MSAPTILGDLEFYEALRRAFASNSIPPEPVRGALLREITHRCRAAQTYLFQDAGRDAHGRPLWRVNTLESPVVFVARSEAMRMLHWLASGRAVSVHQITQAASGAEAARGKLRRAIDDLDEYSPALAGELRTFTIEGGIVRYRRTARSPRILTD